MPAIQKIPQFGQYESIIKFTEWKGIPEIKLPFSLQFKRIQVQKDSSPKFIFLFSLNPLGQNHFFSSCSFQSLHYNPVSNKPHLPESKALIKII